MSMTAGSLVCSAVLVAADNAHRYATTLTLLFSLATACSAVWSYKNQQ
jgi:hypothetical protein